MSSKARQHALKHVDSGYKKICIIFDYPFHIIRKRCLRERRMSLAVAREIWNQFEKPTERELLQQSFDKAYFISTEVVVL